MLPNTFTATVPIHDGNTQDMVFTKRSEQNGTSTYTTSTVFGSGVKRNGTLEVKHTRPTASSGKKESSMIRVTFEHINPDGTLQSVVRSWHVIESTTNGDWELLRFIGGVVPVIQGQADVKDEFYQGSY